MKIIQLGRGAGKTSTLIKHSASNGERMVCRNKKNAGEIMRMAKKMGVTIKEPITFDELLGGSAYRGLGIRKIMIDDLDQLLEYWFGLDVGYCTYTPK